MMGQGWSMASSYLCCWVCFSLTHTLTPTYTNTQAFSGLYTTAARGLIYLFLPYTKYSLLYMLWESITSRHSRTWQLRLVNPNKTIFIQVSLYCRYFTLLVLPSVCLLFWASSFSTVRSYCTSHGAVEGMFVWMCTYSNVCTVDVN